MRFMALFTFLPEEIIPVLMVLGGLAFMVQARRLAMTLFTFCGLMIFLPVLLEPMLDMMPEWVLTLLIIFLWISIPFTVLHLLIGKSAWNEMVGTLAADVIRFCFLLPFRFIGMVFRMFRR